MPSDAPAAWPERATTVLLGPPGTVANDWRRLRDGDVPLDLPGHGRQVRTPGWSLDTLAQDVVDRFVGPLDVVGVGGAADLVLTLLTQWSHRVRSAVLVCPNVIAAAPSTVRERQLACARAQAASVSAGGMALVVDEQLDAALSPFARRADRDGVRRARESFLATDPAAYADALTAAELSSTIGEDKLDAIRQPVTIVAGTVDRVAGTDPASRLHTLLRRSRLELWPGSHWAHLEMPEIVRTAIDRHGVWAPVGQRVDRTLGSAVLLDVADEPWGGAA